MADQLATPEDLAAALQLDYAGLTPIQQASMALLVECATAVVQEAAGGQRIVQVVDDELTIMGLSDSWLDLPQIPVTAVSAVTIDGEATTHWRKFGDRLFRRYGWQRDLGAGWRYGYGYSSQFGAHHHCDVPEPSVITVTCTHGYAPGAQELQLGRSAVLSLATPVFENPGGRISESIDDYSATYASSVAAMSAAMDASPYHKAAIRRQYGRRAGLVRIG
jgi:hypothetical protein